MGPQLRRRCKSSLPCPTGAQNALGPGALSSVPPNGARINFVQDHSEDKQISRRARRAGRRPLTVATYNANGWASLRTFLEGAPGSCIVASQEVRRRPDERLESEE
eukprot:9218290-Pyramimonas_sp.AAC.1